MAGKKTLLGWFGWVKSLVGRLRRIKSPLRWLRRIQWWYWHHADDWPLSALRRYGKALFILLLWTLTATGFFYLLIFLLPDTLHAPPTGRGADGVSKESVALLGSLLTALIGFGLQQWKGQEEEERRRREEEDSALSLIGEEFCDLLHRDPSEAARRYLDLRRKGGVWQSNRVRARIEEIWEKGASPELRCAISVMEELPERGEFDRSKQVDALLWAYNHLDEDWKSRAANALIVLGGTFPAWAEEAWRAMLGIWPEITLGRGRVSIPDRRIFRGLHHLGLNINPFGSEKAEADAHLLKARVVPLWWERLASLSPGLFFTAPGGGRTAAALLLAYDVLYKRTAFPVYCRVETAQLDLEGLAWWTAQAIARYIALSPPSFTKCPYSTKRAIKRLLSGYMPVDPLLYLQEAGMPSIGEGGKVLEEFRTYLAGSSGPSFVQTDLVALLGEARPADFPRTLILADVQGVVDTEDVILSFYALQEALAQARITLQVFLAASPTTNLQKYGESLEWSEEDLRALLQNRLRLLSSDDSLDAWSDIRVWEGPPVEMRLIAAAARNPRELIDKGNALLRRIGETGCRLIPQDLDEVLGSV